MGWFVALSAAIYVATAQQTHDAVASDQRSCPAGWACVLARASMLMPLSAQRVGSLGQPQFAGVYDQLLLAEPAPVYDVAWATTGPTLDVVASDRSAPAVPKGRLRILVGSPETRASQVKTYCRIVLRRWSSGTTPAFMWLLRGSFKAGDARSIRA